jgi:hypothetical protein
MQNDKWERKERCEKIFITENIFLTFKDEVAPPLWGLILCLTLFPEVVLHAGT